uniref:Immunoglobulin V-set domain-containing protein n=1 Tax=Poecilia latipinna TaxID=48699 RepID=A0A3B3UU27_9TELE
PSFMKTYIYIKVLLALKLQDGNAVRRETGVEGGNIAVTCPFLLSGSRKFVCKDKCGGENILIETTNNTAERGRYSVKYERNIIIFKDFLYFTIKDLKKSDSGRYRCLFSGWLVNSKTLFKQLFVKLAVVAR